jgi:hypothetical protein
MTSTRRNTLIALTAGLGLGLLSGCQTYVPEASLTLPSPHYLQHPPQYIPPSEQAPLPNETRSLESATRKFYDDQRQPGP